MWRCGCGNYSLHIPFEMKLFFTVLSIVFIISCSPKTYVYVANNNLFGDLTNGLPDKDTAVTIYYKDGSTKAIGSLAVTDSNLPSSVKAGYWQEYYESGGVKSEGNYKIGKYLNCCAGGAYWEYYSYKDGIWKYYNGDGKLAFELEFIPEKLQIHTNCEGGALLTFGLIKNVPLNYLEKVTPDKIFEIQKVTIEEPNINLTYTPLNGNVYITVEPKL